MAICSRYQRVFWFYDTEKMTIGVGRLRCKQWSCPACATENRKQWRNFLHGKLPYIASDWRLMTLTASANQRTRIDSYNALKRGIDVLIKRFNRAFSAYEVVEVVDKKTGLMKKKKRRVGLEYVRVYEKHPTSDALHAHIIISGLKDYVKVERSGNGKYRYVATNFRAGKRGFWSLRTFVKKTAQAAGMGYIADVKSPASSNRAIQYVTKYMTKDAQSIGIRGLRHVQTSRGIGSMSQRKASSKVHVGYRLMDVHLVAGMSVTDIDTGEKLPDDYWIDANVYPPLDDNRQNEL